MAETMSIRLTPASKRRRQLVQSVVADAGSILEIGAMAKPTFIRDLGDDVRYLDWFSGDELRERHQNNPKRSVANIVDVDYVVKHHQFASSIPDRFDLIVAAHVVEHVADVVSWLQQLESLLAPGGTLYLAVPDRRYTFDYHRRTSNVVDIIRAHEEGLERPTKWQIADATYHYSPVDREALWDGTVPPFRPRFSLAEALRRAERRAHEYADVHCWVFTPDSFAEVLDGLRQCGLVGLAVKRLDPPQRGTNEFSVFLTADH